MTNGYICKRCTFRTKAKYLVRGGNCLEGEPTYEKHLLTAVKQAAVDYRSDTIVVQVLNREGNVI